MVTQLLGRKCRKASGNNSRQYRVVMVYATEYGLSIVIEDVQTGSLSTTDTTGIRMEPQP